MFCFHVESIVIFLLTKMDMAYKIHPAFKRPPAGSLFLPFSQLAAWSYLWDQLSPAIAGYIPNERG